MLGGYMMLNCMVIGLNNEVLAAIALGSAEHFIRYLSKFLPDTFLISASMFRFFFLFWNMWLFASPLPRRVWRIVDPHVRWGRICISRDLLHNGGEHLQLVQGMVVPAGWVAPDMRAAQCLLMSPVSCLLLKPWFSALHYYLTELEKHPLRPRVLRFESNRISEAAKLWH